MKHFLDHIPHQQSSLPTGHLHLYLIQHAEIPTPANTTLSAHDMNRTKYMSPIRKTQFISNRYFIHQVLSTYTEEPIELIISPGGKPTLVEHLNLAFSITHEASDLILGITKGSSLGIDTQSRPPKNPTRYIRRFNHPVDTSTNTLLSDWMLKEAYCKYSDTPLFQTLSKNIQDTLSQEQLFYGKTMHENIPCTWVTQQEITTIQWYIVNPINSFNL